MPFETFLGRLKVKVTLEGQLSVTGESMCTKYWLTA